MADQFSAVVTALVGAASVVVNYLVLRNEREKLRAGTQLQEVGLELGRREKVAGAVDRKAYEEKDAAYQEIVAETARMNALLRAMFVEVTSPGRPGGGGDDASVRAAAERRARKIDKDLNGCIEQIMAADRAHSFRIPRYVHEQLTKYWLFNAMRQKEGILVATVEYLVQKGAEGSEEGAGAGVAVPKDGAARSLHAAIDQLICLNRDLKDLLVGDAAE